MANRNSTFLLKRSNVIDKVPNLTGLTIGELALNTADSKLYTIFTSGTTGATEVRQIGWDRVSKTGDTITGDLYVTGKTITGQLQVTGGTLTSGYVLTSDGSGNAIWQAPTGGGGSSGDYLPLSGGTVTGGTIFNSGLTANTIYTDYIDFNTGATVTQSTGRVSWDSGTGTLNISVGDVGTGFIDLQVGQEEIVRVYNGELTTLVKGEIVYVSGSQGNRPAVKRASAVNDGYSVTTLGMVDSSISSGSEGYVTTFGIISNLNTSGLTGGTPIWLSPTTPGAYTTTKPIAPDHTVLIGYVVRVSSTVGSIFINISNGWELDELHDVRISGVTTGDLLMRSSYSGSPVWVNTKTLEGSYTVNGNLTVTGNTNLQSLTAGTSTINGTLTVTGNTRLQGLTATTISATTYQNLPTDIRVTGATYSNNTFTYTNNTGGTFNVNFNTVTGLTINGNLSVTGNTSMTGTLSVTGNTNVRSFTGTSGYISGSGQNILTVIGSGNSTTSPLFTVQGSSGELFSVTDSLTGSLFSVNDISGLPILEVFSNNTILQGSYLSPSLNTTVKTSLTAGTNSVYSIPTSAYTGAFFDYTLISIGSTGARAGTIMSIWSGSTTQYTDVSTNDIGTTTGVTFSVAVSGSNAVLSSSATTSGWTLKTIVRSI